jgi:glycosyltransferase involved in cell wall biosynthesis
MLKSLGLPIVASPVASYLETLVHGKSGYFARNIDEWSRYLEALAEPAHRREIGLADRDHILARYGLEAIGDRWLHLFERLARERSGAARV